MVSTRESLTFSMHMSEDSSIGQLENDYITRWDQDDFTGDVGLVVGSDFSWRLESGWEPTSVEIGVTVERETLIPRALGCYLMLHIDKRALSELLETIFDVRTFYRDLGREVHYKLVSPGVAYKGMYEGQADRPAFDHVE